MKRVLSVLIRLAAGASLLLAFQASSIATAQAQPAKPKPAATQPPGQIYLGLREVTLPDEGEPKGIRTYLWYPTRMQPEQWGPNNPYLILVRPEATPIPGRRPLIVISHGTGGDPLSLHHFAEFLVMNGYIVAMPRHPHDNNEDASDANTDRQIVGRSRHIARVIDGTLRDEVVGPLIDSDRIGMLGFSAGAFTALTVLGAVPDFDRLVEYCQGKPDDDDCKGKDRTERPDWRQTPDPRVKAAIIMGFGGGYLFSRKTLRSITVPMLMFRAENDEYSPFNEEWLEEAMGRKPEYHLVPGPHLIFLAPCPPGRNDEICRNPPGVDRRAVLASINAEMLDFLQRTLR